MSKQYNLKRVPEPLAGKIRQVVASLGWEVRCAGRHPQHGLEVLHWKDSVGPTKKETP